MKPKENKKTHKQPPPSAKYQTAKVSKKANYIYYLLLFIILVISLIAYLPVFHNEFVNWDDNQYILDNPFLSQFNLKEIFSRFEMGNYHPLTMLLYTIEYDFFSVSPVGYHVISLFIHLLIVILVYRVVFSLSNKAEVALIAALLFGIHPLHVESVAWASEQKDLLYTFFFLASYLCYMKYLKAFNRMFYFYCLLLFLLSLFSKAMAASLPVLLVLTDYFKSRKINSSALLEKIPFFALSLVFGIIAVKAQHSTGSVQDPGFHPFYERIAFACYGFITYIIQLFLPLHLSALYPYPVSSGESIPPWYYVYVLLFILLFIAVIYSMRYTKKIVFGTGFFAITVFLVLQLLPVGNAIMADRYSYIPSIGIFYLAGEGFYSLWHSNKTLGLYRFSLLFLLAVATIFFSFKTYARCGVWKNGMTLWNDVISQNRDIPLAYNNRGALLKDENRFNEALDDYNNAIKLKRDYASAYVNRANLFRDQNKFDLALADYNKAIELQPNDAETYNNRGILMMNAMKYEDALSDYNKSLQLQPNFVKAYNNLGLLYIMQNKFTEALTYCNKAIELKSDFGEAYYNRARIKYNLGDKNQACIDLQHALKLKVPHAKETYNQLCH